MAETNAAHPRLLRAEDLQQVVQVHRICFPQDLYTSLGLAFHRGFYAALLSARQTRTAVLEDSATGMVVGFATGSFNPSLYRDMLKRNLHLAAWGALVGLFTSPVVRGGLKKALRRLGRIVRTEGVIGMDQAGIPPADGPVARLLYIGMLPEYRGGGNAQRLLQYCAEQLFALGAVRVAGIVPGDNLPSLILYKKAGWNVQKTGGRYYVWADRR